MGFNEVTAAGQSFAENSDVFGESFTYANNTFTGVFNQVDIDYRFDEFSVRKITGLICVSSKPQWDAVSLVPQERAHVTYGGIDYPIQSVAGPNSAGEPAYQLTLFRLT